MKTITESEGYKKLLAAVERDEKQSPKNHDYRKAMAFAMSRAEHYAEKTGLEAADILDAWEKDRTYWYMNYYQEANQPQIKGDGAVRVFDTLDALKQSIGSAGFRCPMCNGVSKSPYECDSGLKMDGKNTCDWKSYGLFRALGKGVFVFVKSEMKGQTIFLPIAYESQKLAENVSERSE